MLGWKWVYSRVLDFVRQSPFLGFPWIYLLVLSGHVEGFT